MPGTVRPMLADGACLGWDPALMSCSLDAFAALCEARRSIRAFRPDPVSDAALERLLKVARRAPSGANLQPGHLHLLRGAVRHRLSADLVRAFRNGDAEREDYTYFPDPMPQHLRRRQVAAGRALYEALGIDRGDRAARDDQFERNFTFFDAPVAMIVTIDARLGTGCYMDLGMMLHGLMLAATAEGLGSCAVGALANYPTVIRRALDLGPQDSVVCGMALGIPDPDAAANRVRTERIALADFVSIHGQD